MKITLLKKVRKRFIIDKYSAVDRRRDIGGFTYKCYDNKEEIYREITLEQMCFDVTNIIFGGTNKLANMIIKKYEARELKKFKDNCK